MLLIEVSVWEWRPPSVSRFVCSASWYSGPAPLRSPFACSSMPRLLIEVRVLGSRSPSVSRLACSASRSSGSASLRSPLS
eukprot:7382519-Prymnesium_polylepis.2